MGELYKLNKDELIKIILNVKKNMTNDELEAELNDRRYCKKLVIVKKMLPNLKKVPHLKDLIEKYDTFIKNVTDVNEFLKSEFFEEAEYVGLGRNGSRGFSPLALDIEQFIFYRDNWLSLDSLIYESCISCGHYTIDFYTGSNIIVSHISFGSSLCEHLH